VREQLDSRVVVCSPRPAVAAELAAALGRLGARTSIAAARADWPREPPDLAFLDLVVGGPSVREARSVFGLETDLVAVVDNESVARLLPALAAGCSDYLFHPLNPAELGLRWRRHRDGRGGSRARRAGIAAEIRLDLPSRVGFVRDAVSEVVDACERLAFAGSRATLNLRIALGEALANAILYGNAEDPTKRVRVTASLRAGEAVVTVADEGPGFDPGTVVDPTRPENRDRSHGRGLFLLRSLADEVRFNERGNAVTLVLRGEAPGG
jgi:serine/threonine-protein kinase RsbW